MPFLEFSFHYIFILLFCYGLVLCFLCYIVVMLYRCFFYLFDVLLYLFINILRYWLIVIFCPCYIAILCCRFIVLLFYNATFVWFLFRYFLLCYCSIFCHFALFNCSNILWCYRYLRKCHISSWSSCIISFECFVCTVLTFCSSISLLVRCFTESSTYYLNFYNITYVLIKDNK